MEKLQNRGFSLIELMVVIAIMSILATFSFSVIQSLNAKAKESEAALNLNSLYTLLYSYYFDENDRMAVNPGYLNSEISRNDFTTPTSCNHNSMYGFKLTDCQKINFAYGVGGSSTTKTLGAYAIEGTKGGKFRIYPKCRGRSYWVNRGSGATHVISPSNPVDCQVCFTTRLAAETGGTNLNFDNNGDGIVNAFDTSWMISTFTVGGKPLGGC